MVNISPNNYWSGSYARDTFEQKLQQNGWVVIDNPPEPSYADSETFWRKKDSGILVDDWGIFLYRYLHFKHNWIRIAGASPGLAEKVDQDQKITLGCGSTVCLVTGTIVRVKS